MHTRALRLEPGLVEARYGLSSSAAALGDLDGAIALLQQVVAKLPTLAEPHYNLGIHYWDRYNSGAWTARPIRSGCGLRGPENSCAAVTERSQVSRRSRAAPGRQAGSRWRRHQPSTSPDAETGFSSTRLRSRARPASRRRSRGCRDAVPRGDGAQSKQRTGAPCPWPRAADEGRSEGRRFGVSRAAVAALPDDAQAHHLLGSLLLNLGETTAARDELRHAIPNRLVPRRAASGIGTGSGASRPTRRSAPATARRATSQRLRRLVSGAP